MPGFWDTKLGERLGAARQARGSRVRGTLYEEFVCALFQSIAGITITQRNSFNVRGSQEIDVAFWNDQQPDGFWFLPNVILVECKNWMSPVTSSEVAWFDDKVRKRGLDFGLLFAARGVTGDRRSLADAHDIVARALGEGRRLLIVTSDEPMTLTDASSLVTLMKIKLTRLHASGTSLG